jgi:hypothetical protein
MSLLPDLGLGTETDLPDLKLGGSDSPQKVKPKTDLPDLGIGTEASAGEKMLYGFKTTPSFSEGIGDWLERRFPMGRIQFYTPGEGWHVPRYLPPPKEVVAAAKAHNYKKAKEILDAKDAYELQSMTPIASTDPNQRGGPADAAGAMAAILLDPTTLIPVGKAAKLSYAQGGLLGAADAIAYGLSTEDEFDPVLGVIGFTGGMVTTMGVRYMGGKLSRMMQAADKKTAENLAQQFEAKVKYYLDQPGGMFTATAFKKAKADMNLNEDAIAGLQLKIGRQLNFSRVHAERDVLIEETQKGLRDFVKKNKVSEAISGVSKFVDDYLGNVSTRIGNISPEVWGRLRRLDFAEHYNTHQHFIRIQPFINDLKKLNRTNKAAYRQLHKAMLNQDKLTSNRIMRKFGTKSMENNFKEVRKVLDELGEGLKGAGYKMELIDNFFPRVIHDVPALMKALPSETSSLIQRNAMAEGIAIEGNPDELGAYLNKYLRGRLTGEQIDQVLGTTKARNIETITDLIQPHYAEPEAALHSYIRRTVHDIERRKFFGRAAVASTHEGDLKLQASIGNVIAESQKKGHMNLDDMEELRDLLVARFDLGNRTGSKMIHNARNIMYMSTIGNPVSALTQVGDIGVSAFAHGLKNTLAATFGRKAVRVYDLGINDIAQEFASTIGTARALEKIMKYSGFKAIDQLGKNVSINAALKKWTRAVKTPKGMVEFRQRYGPMFGADIEKVALDLKNGHISDNVKMMLFSELADLQPITLSEMPLKYLQNPNGRIAYMLKTFTIKQLDIMRRSVFKEFSTGSKAKAIKNAAAYLAFVNTFNLGAQLSKEAVLTGEINPDAIPDEAISTLFKNFGASEYMLNKYGSKGQVGTLLGQLVMPPLNVVDGLAGIFLDPDNINTHMKHMPVVGRFWYYWMGDGIQRMHDRRESKANDEFNRESTSNFDGGSL